MHGQAPTLTTPHLSPRLAATIGLASAAIVAGGIAIATRDNSTTPAVAPATPAVVQNAPTRELDGSPLLRGAAAAPAVTISSQSGLARVWDGSPTLRLSAPSTAVRNAVPHSGGGPRSRAVTSSLAGTTSAQSQPQFPVRPPEGFHRVP